MKKFFSKYKTWCLPSKINVWSFTLSLIGGVLSAIALIQIFYPKENMLETIARAEYKPKVEFIEAKITNWVGDPDPYFNVYLNNDSKGSANNFVLKIYDGNKELVPKKRHKANMTFSGTYSIRPGQTTSIPVMTISELANSLSIPKENILGFSPEKNTPENIAEIARKRHFKNGRDSYRLIGHPILLTYSYTGIPDFESTSNILVNVFYDATNIQVAND